MSLNLNQRICALQKNASDNHAHSSSFKWSALAFALTAVLFSQSATAASLLDINHASTPATQRNVNFEQVLQDVKQHQAGIGVWQTQQSIAEANVKQARLWTNPSISIQQTDFRSGKDKELEFGLSQKLDVFGERRAAVKLADVQASQVGLNQELYDAQLELAVKYLWSQVVVLELEHDVVRAQLKTSQATLDATRLRLQAGSIAQVDLDRTLMAHIENQRLFQQTELALATAKRQLANLWGSTDNRFSAQASNVWPQQKDLQAYVQNNLFERAIQLDIVRQKANIDYLKVSNRPNPTVNLGMVQSKSAETNSTDNKFRVGIDIPLNIFNRQQYSLRIANAKQDLLVKQQQFYKQQNLNAIQTLSAELAGLKQQFDLVNQRQIPLSETVQEKMLLGFKVGKYAITDVQQATMQLQEQRLNKVQLLKSAWQKQIEAESLALGIEPGVVSSSDALNQINQNLWKETSNLPAVVGAE
ncbi:RND transporter [Acinetobacter sp. NRRL B-65365]|uniref:TolC family protein n=1 Tax=Acinetobacter sp. NRRL B-65365 TaxID=1785092 RepID=UPI0007A0601C|nr:TolC family protein [Acinetobacter sp. NRRL B-65365]KYQ85250.1 RND transporter [Acinetobacter sp. NRRL B-65365]